MGGCNAVCNRASPAQARGVGLDREEQSTMTMCVDTVTEGKMMDMSGFESYMKTIREVISEEMPTLSDLNRDKLALEVANKLMHQERDWVTPAKSGMASPF